GRSTSLAAELCGKNPTFRVEGRATADCCTKHAPDGMADVIRRKCRTEGCSKFPLFGVVGSKTVECCEQHAPPGWSGAESAKPKVAASFRLLEYQVQKRWSTAHGTHRKGWSTVLAGSGRTEGCGKEPSFGVGGTKTKMYCAQHALEGMVDVKHS
ncbi:unnamed protein product, partial [Ascophyllum nodosum]